MRTRQAGIALIALGLFLWPLACQPARAQGSGSSRDSGSTAGKSSAVDYEGILRMLKEGVDEKEILQKVEDSPTHFTLSGRQIGELKDAGASSRLIKALQSKSATASISSDVGDYALILDCSGSMNDKMPDGGTKMEAAKKVVADFIKNLPDGKRLTFIVYGHKVYGNDKRRGCQAVEVALPLRPLTPDLKEQLGRLIDQLQAKGWTPLAASLHLAGEELKKAQGLCQVIVVTDGMETCGGDPAQEAADLNKQLQLPGGVDIIGFNVTPDEKEAVKKIVDDGRGQYYDSTTVQDLIKNLRKVVENPRPRPRPRPTRVRTNQGKDIVFPAGDISWADRVVSFKPGHPGPRRSKDPRAAIGPPDYRGRDDREDEKHYVALGHGGVLVLEFTDNVLVDGPGPDLAVFEIGPAIEPMFIAISEDGKEWIDVGKAEGGKSTLDIHRYVKPGQQFRFVRITDAKAGLSNNSDWPGADIDAVGAINTLPASAH